MTFNAEVWLKWMFTMPCVLANRYGDSSIVLCRWMS
jgi:hypothetical protein